MYGLGMERVKDFGCGDYFPSEVLINGAHVLWGSSEEFAIA